MIVQSKNLNKEGKKNIIKKIIKPNNFKEEGKKF